MTAYYITETVVYLVAADSEEEAMGEFLEADNINDYLETILERTVSTSPPST